MLASDGLPGGGRFPSAVPGVSLRRFEVPRVDLHQARCSCLALRPLVCSADLNSDRIRRIPGTDENGEIKEADLRTWVTETRVLCVELGRAAIGDQKIGQVLSSAPVDADGIWPCEPVRNVLEDIASREIGIGLGVAVYNARGAHSVSDDAAGERALAEKYRAWSRKLAFGYAYVASVLEEIAQRYDREAERWISDAAVRRRLKGW